MQQWITVREFGSRSQEIFHQVGNVQRVYICFWKMIDWGPDDRRLSLEMSGSQTQMRVFHVTAV